MNVLLDQGLPRSAALPLRAAGHEALHVGELEMARATDDEILAAARTMGAVVVTLDADFHSLLALSHATTPSVVRLRVQGKGARELAALILTILAAVGDDLAQGAVVTANEAHLRMRRLPIA
jgi:predicted nuclease of predicted toxin-antitoxin system